MTSTPASGTTALHEGEGYSGSAHVVVGSDAIEVTVDLRGQFEPLDGTFHWYGRLDPVGSALLEESVRSGSTVAVRTSYGEAAGLLSDRDPWGRFRVAGQGRPPFPV
jgi:hypothetical protein